MKLIKINTDHYIIVDDSEIKEDDFVYSINYKTITFVNKERVDYITLPTVKGLYKKITHSTQPLGFLNEYGSTADLKCDWTNVKFLPISEVKELIGEVDVEKKAVKCGKEYQHLDGDVLFDHPEYFAGFFDGYNQCLEDNKDKKYTEDDLITFGIRVTSEAFSIIDGKGYVDMKKFDKILQSLQPKTEWEVEIIDGQLKLKQ